MSIQLLIKSVQRGATIFLPKITENAGNKLYKGFHSLNTNFVRSPIVPNILTKNLFENLLRPPQPLLNLTCGMKTKGKLKLRCKDCYFVCYKARWYVRCLTHPRHKQMQLQKAERNTWILTSVCQSKKRAWW